MRRYPFVGFFYALEMYSAARMICFCPVFRSLLCRNTRFQRRFCVELNDGIGIALMGMRIYI